CSGRADVVISQSSGRRPRMESRTHPPTIKASNPWFSRTRKIFSALTGMVSFILICSSPVYHLLRRLAAADADVADMLLFKRHTSGCCLNVLFDLIFTFSGTAPHGFYESRFCVDKFFKLVIVFRRIGMAVAVGSGSLQHVFLHGIQYFLYFCRKFFKRYHIFLSGIPAADHSLSVLDIL